MRAVQRRLCDKILKRISAAVSVWRISQDAQSRQYAGQATWALGKEAARRACECARVSRHAARGNQLACASGLSDPAKRRLRLDNCDFELFESLRSPKASRSRPSSSHQTSIMRGQTISRISRWWRW